MLVLVGNALFVSFNRLARNKTELAVSLLSAQVSTCSSGHPLRSVSVPTVWLWGEQDPLS